MVTRGNILRRTRNQGRLRRLYNLRQERVKIVLQTMSKLKAGSRLALMPLGVRTHRCSKNFGRTIIVNKFSTRLMRGDRVGIIGPNGVGKTTLLKLLSGDLEPDSGQIRNGTNIGSIIIDQKRETLDLNKTLWDTLADSGGDQINVLGHPRHVSWLFAGFLFHEKQARSPVGSLSGGEKNRLLLAKHLARPSNLMILDEPTNDLDMETLDLLQEMLSDYKGTIILVSHDRDFIDQVVTSTIVFEGHGKITEYARVIAIIYRRKKIEIS